MTTGIKRWEELTLRDKIGQLFLCGFAGTEPSEHIVGLIREYGIGGVIYFRRNAANAAQLSALSARLQAESAVPLLLAIDQEGGMVVRLEEGVTVMPGAMAQGAAEDAALTREAAALAAAELRRIGVNMNFAPCLDVNNNPRNPVIGVRSYGERPSLVSRLGTAAIAGWREGGVAAVAKHFPGHGDTAVDSHRGLPVVPHGADRLDAVELRPFRDAIAAGVDAIMTAHVAFPAYEPSGRPATLSAPILTGLLRERLGFEGVIVTDCLEMSAIAETIGVARGAVEAIKAGADLVLVSHRPDRQRAALEAVLEAVMAGELAESRIEEAARRLWRLKAAYGLFGGSAPTASDAAMRADAGRAADAARLLSERAVTVMTGEPLLPLPKAGKATVVWTEARVGTEVVEVVAQRWTLGAALAAEGYDVEETRIGIEPTEEEATAARRAVERNGGPVVFASYDASFSEWQAALVRELADTAAETAGRTFALVAMRTPYDWREAPDVPVYIAAYENKPTMMSAVAGVLSGRLRASARLPVTVGPFGAQSS